MGYPVEPTDDDTCATTGSYCWPEGGRPKYCIITFQGIDSGNHDYFPLFNGTYICEAGAEGIWGWWKYLEGGNWLAAACHEFRGAHEIFLATRDKGYQFRGFPTGCPCRSIGNNLHIPIHNYWGGHATWFFSGCIYSNNIQDLAFNQLLMSKNDKIFAEQMGDENNARIRLANKFNGTCVHIKQSQT